MTGTERVAARLVSGQTSREVPGQAVSAGDGTHVQVQIGVQVWTATDLPKRPAAVGDMLTIRERQGSRQVVRNLTREANPPEADSAPSDASTTSSSGGTNSTVSSGQYAWTDGTQMGTYVNEMSAVTRGLAGDLNAVRTLVNNNASAANSAKTVANDAANKVNALAAAFETLLTALRNQGVIQ